DETMSAKRKDKSMSLGVIAAIAVALPMSCGKKKKDDEAAAVAPGTALSISGVISLTATSSASLIGFDSLGLTGGSSDATSLEANKLNCTVFSDPPVYTTGTFDADGKFSVAVAGAGYPIGCAVVDSDGAQVSSFVFQNDAKKDLAGNGSLDARVSLSGSADLGTVTSDGDAGKAVIDVSKISNIAAASITDAFDFTGKWVFAKATVIPDGYTSPCTTAEAEAARKANKSTCDGPSIDEKIWIKRLNGKTVASGAASYAVQVWQSEDAFKECGSKLGFSYAEGKAKAGIDLTDSGVAEGSFDWTTGWTDGWKSSAAKNGSWAMQDCQSTTYKTKEAYKCTAENGNYRIQLPGGCLTAAGKPVKVENWSSMTGGAPTTDSVTGLLKFTSTGTVNGVAVTCTNISGSFDSAGTAIAGNTQITPRTLVAEGALCSSIPETSDTLKLAKLRCYANGYWEGGDKGGSSCTRKVDMDWTATDPAKFIANTDGPGQAKKEHVLALLNYTDKDTASMHDEHVGYRSTQVNGQMVNCKIRDAFTLTMRRITDTSATAEFVTEQKTVDKGKAACVSAFTDSVSKQFMLLNKN
ncbi:MAG: hypothetical protein NTV34_12810, partial [Proteobacteria bacterium]|nr:hypothetical protein [Pseudomonadota bacterium]